MLWIHCAPRFEGFPFWWQFFNVVYWNHFEDKNTGSIWQKRGFVTQKPLQVHAFLSPVVSSESWHLVISGGIPLLRALWLQIWKLLKWSVYMLHVQPCWSFWGNPGLVLCPKVNIYAVRWWGEHLWKEGTVNLCLLSGVYGCVNCSLLLRVRFYGNICLCCGFEANIGKEAHAFFVWQNGGIFFSQV